MVRSHVGHAGQVRDRASDPEQSLDAPSAGDLRVGEVDDPLRGRRRQAARPTESAAAQAAVESTALGQRRSSGPSRCAPPRPRTAPGHAPRRAPRPARAAGTPRCRSGRAGAPRRAGRSGPPPRSCSGSAPPAAIRRTRTGTGSWPRPAGTGPGRSSPVPLGRSPRGPPRAAAAAPRGRRGRIRRAHRGTGPPDGHASPHRATGIGPPPTMAA